MSSRLKSRWVDGDTTESSLDHLDEIDCKREDKIPGVLCFSQSEGINEIT